MKNITEIKPPHYTYLESTVHLLREKYSALTLATCGKSVMGKEIFALSVGEGMRNIIYVGSTHALEWITTLIMLRFAETLAQNCELNKNTAGFNTCDILKNIRLVVVPCLNPDGVDIQIKGTSACGEFKEKIYDISKFDFTNWSANANGVDLNHNFNADWYALRDFEGKNGIAAPAPRRYGGKFPESEPETRAIIKLLRSIEFDRLYTFHSQGEEIFYNYKNNTPEKSLFIAKALGGVSGYTLVNNEGHYSSGGLKDWFIEEFKKPGFTVEVGLGKNPLPLEDFSHIYKKIEPLLVMGLML